MNQPKLNPLACAAHASSSKTKTGFTWALKAYGFPDDYVNYLVWCRDNREASVSLEEFEAAKATFLHLVTAMNDKEKIALGWIWRDARSLEGIENARARYAPCPKAEQTSNVSSSGQNSAERVDEGDSHPKGRDYAHDKTPVQKPVFREAQSAHSSRVSTQDSCRCRVRPADSIRRQETG